MPSAVLIVSDKSGITVHVLGAGGLHSGPLSNLRALATKAKARGNTLLIAHGDLAQVTVPEDVPTGQLLDFLDAQSSAKAVSNPNEGRPTLIANCQGEAVAQAIGACKSAGLRPTLLIPLDTASLLAVPEVESAAIIQALPQGYLTSVVSPVEIKSQANNKVGRTLDQVAEIALRKPRSSGDNPDVVVVHHIAAPHDPIEVDGAKCLMLTIEDVLRAAMKGNTQAIGAQPSSIVRGMRRPLTPQSTVSPLLIGVVAAGLAINGGIFVAANMVNRQVSQLQAQKATLEMQAAQTRALRKANDQLEQRVKQAQTLTADKGPLAHDLPLISARVQETDTHFVSLNGPTSATASDALAFGGPTTNIYLIAAKSASPENLASAYTGRGLRADIQRIDCKAKVCDVGLRVGIAQEQRSGDRK